MPSRPKGGFVINYCDAVRFNCNASVFRDSEYLCWVDGFPSGGWVACRVWACWPTTARPGGLRLQFGGSVLRAVGAALNLLMGNSVYLKYGLRP